MKRQSLNGASSNSFFWRASHKEARWIMIKQWSWVEGSNPDTTIKIDEIMDYLMAEGEKDKLDQV